MFATRLSIKVVIENDTYNASAFTGASGPFNQFLGNGGNDTITGNGSTQLYYGAATAGISATLNAGGSGTIVGDSSVGSDTINGGVKNIVGCNFNDTFTLNSPGSNFQSIMTGNGGNDTFVFKPNFGNAGLPTFIRERTRSISIIRCSPTSHLFWQALRRLALTQSLRTPQGIRSRCRTSQRPASMQAISTSYDFSALGLP